MKLIYPSIISIILFSSCQKVIEIDLNDSEFNFVIEASYDATEQEATAKLSYTTNFFGINGSEEIADAIVTIEDENGVSYPLTYSGESTYSISGLAPDFETSYTMKVNQGGIDYSATSFLAPFIALDTMTSEFAEASAFGPEGYIAFLGITDQLNYSNYYRAIFTVNDTVLDPVSSGIFYFNDDFTDGNSFTIPLFSERFSVGDTIECELRSINQSRSLYLSGLEDVINSSAAAPTNPITNWSNNALGFFNVYSQDQKQIVVVE